VEELKGWEKVAELGNRIIKKLQTQPHDEPLKSWIAYRVAELMEYEKKAKTARKREVLRKECSDLIIKIWKIRRRYDPNDPINKINHGLDVLLSGSQPSCVAFQESQIPDGMGAQRKLKKLRYDEILTKIMELADKERRVVFAATTAEFPEELTDEIQDIEDQQAEKLNIEHYDQLITLRDLLFQKTQSEDIKDIANAKTKTTRKKAVAKALHNIDVERKAYIKMMG